MDKVFHFDAPRRHYIADAAVVMCFDLRFNLTFHKFLKSVGVRHYDLIKVAGGAKCLSSPEAESEQGFVLDQLKKSIRLHQTKRVVLMVHADCGAYGGSEAFETDDAEATHLEAELQTATAVLRNAIPHVTVEAYFVDFHGVWVAEPRPAAA